MLMKKQFLSKSVPRGTRTIWRYLGALFILFTFAIGNVWADDVTISAAEMVAGSTKSHITPAAGADAAVSEQQVWLDGSTKKKYDCLSLSSASGTGEVLGALKTKSVFFTVDAGYKITGFTVSGASNKDASTTAPIVMVCWTGDISRTPALITQITLPHRQTSSLPSIVASSIPNGTKTIALYRRVKVNNTTTPTELVSSGGSDYGSANTGNIVSVTITYEATTPATKHTVTYSLNGAEGTTPTQADVAEGAKFTLHNGTTGITAPANKKFDGWHDGTTKYAGGAEYTMGTSNVTLTAQWVDDLPDPTATFTGATYIIGSGTLNMSANFESNSTGAVTYSLKEASANASITEAGVFSATAAGEYVVVANQVATATYSAISKEATVTVLDDELSDTYVWKKGTGYTGCVASPNADAPAAQYTDVTVEGMSAVSSGRPSTAGTTVTITFSVKAAYSSLFGIENICTYGKLEEPAGGQISWDGGTNWEDLAAYTEGKKEFAPAAGTFPTSFKIKFVGVSTSSGGLWWRNALVTLQVKKTVSGVTEALVGAEINGEAISAANLSTLQEDKTLDIATAYAAAPTVTFKKQVTTSYEGGWAPDVTNVDVEVTASDNTSVWQASATIGGQAYTINLAKPAGPSLETEATAFTLTSAKIATDSKNFTFSGVNLAHSVTIALESDVAGMSVTPAVVIPTENAITDQEVTITYKSLENVDEAVVNLIVAYDEDTKITIPLTYSSTVGYEDLTSISAATTWNWDGAASAAYGTLGQNDMIILANADVTWDEGFNARAIAGKLQHYYRDGKYAQGDELKFNTTIPGKVYVTYSNTGGNDPRTVNVNGTKGSLSSSNNKDADKRTESFSVSAGDVLIKGVQVSDDAAKMLRYYEVRFAPVFAVTYDAGEGSVKGGETMPTQADEAAGEKIILAAATALEKDGYDFAGWLCDIDAQTYQPGDEYTMTAAATSFTAQWVLHVEPVDPTLTYDEGAYMVGGAALDLSSLITAQTSTGAISYSIKDAGTTGATLEGKNFSATAAGTAVITASQEVALGYNAKTVDFNVVVTEATEIDGIKMVEAGALTGNFRIKAAQLKSGAYTVEGINYAKYVQMGSTHTSFSGETEGNQAKGIYYAPAKKNIKFWFYMRNTESTTTRKIYIYTIEEGESITSQTVEVEAGSHLVSADITLSKNAEIVFGVDNTKLCFCQIVAVESGEDLLQGGQNGYVFDYSKKRQNVAANTLRTIDGIDYKLSAESKINSASNVQLTTLGTHYIKFHLDAQMQVKVYADNKKYYIGSECSTGDNAKLYEATGNGDFTLTEGNWYINGSGEQVKINKIEFNLPKCAKPVVADLDNVDYCTGETIDALTVSATVSDGGAMLYQWYKDGVAIEGADEATYQPTADADYYVVVVNTLAGHQNSDPTQSNTITVTGHAGTVITGTTGAEDWPGADVTISVTASGKNLHYAWYTCDDAMGTNPVAVDPAVNAAELDVIVAATDSYYKVIVSGDCGSAQEAVITVVARQAVEQVNVTEATVWNFATSIAGSTSLENQTDVVLANVDGINNNASFNSQALKGTFNKMPGNYFQGSKLSFTTEVAGMLRVIFRGTNNNSRHLQICVGEGEEVIADWDYKGSGEGAEKDSAIYVPAGKVTLKALEGTAAQNARIYRMELVTEDSYHRTVNPSNIGTLCWTNDAVLGGATLYELAGKDANSKLVFDEVPENRLEAGKPYIFVPENGNTVIKVYNTTDAGPLTEPLGAINEMQGTFVDMTTVGTTEGVGDLWYKYIISNNHYIYVDYQNCNLGAYRAYFRSIDAIPAASEEPEPNTNGAPRRRLVVGGNQAPTVVTGVENLNASEQPIKLMIDGQIFILRGEKMYDATGRLVK